MSITADWRSVLTIEGFEFRTDRAYDPAEGFWVQWVAEDIVRVGVHALTAEIYGALAHVAINERESALARGESFGSVEAAKFVGPLLAPVNGFVHLVNDGVFDNPDLVLADPYGEGWLIEIALAPESGVDLLVDGDLAIAWFAQTVREHREKGLVAE